MSKLQSKTNYIIVEDSPVKIEVWKSTKSTNYKGMMYIVKVLVLLLNDIYLPMKFQVSSLNTFRVMLRTKFKHENEQRAITPKVWSLALWFLCTAILLNEIYLHMKFHVNALHCFKVILLTKKDGRTDWRTDRRTDESITTGICHPSGA